MLLNSMCIHRRTQDFTMDGVHVVRRRARGRRKEVRPPVGSTPGESP